MVKNSATTSSKSKKCQVTNTKLKFFQAIQLKFKTCFNRRLSMKALCLWPKIKQLIVLSLKYKENYML